MPVRSINLKLLIPRDDSHASLRQTLWVTHSEVNAATRYYEEQLLALRAEPYERGQTSSNQPASKVTPEEARALALSVARARQAENLRRAGSASTVVGSDDDVLAAVNDLYRKLLPEETGEGSAQDANAYLSPLTTPGSKGFAAAADKLGRPRPNWVAMPPDDPAAADAAVAWFDSAASAEWQKDTGSPAKWLRAARQNKSDWPKLFREKLEELQQKSAQGPEAVIARLQTLHLLPLFEPYFPKRMVEQVRGGVTPWDRLAFRLAVSHLLSWEAWCRRASDDRDRRIKRRDDYAAANITSDIGPLIEKIRVFETARAQELSRLGLGQAEYQLRPRQLRGWADLREAWRKAKARDAGALRTIVAEHQTRKKGKFGDPHVFLWLAEPAQHDLWSGAADVVTSVATLNAIQALVDRSRETATMTLPDARLHPRAVQWAAIGDTNLRPYRVAVDDRGIARAKLSLLGRDVSEKLVEREESFVLSPSGQMRDMRLSMRDKKQSIEFLNDGGETFTGTVGSADLLLDRRHLTRAREEEIQAGAIGPAWLKLVLDLDLNMPAGWDRKHARFRLHFLSASGSKSKAEDALRAGARVLAVDLGIRAFGACSVFVLQQARPSASAMCFEVPLADGTSMHAVHERSFHLQLPSEEPGRDGELWRRSQEEQLRRIRGCFARYRRLMRLAGAEVDVRSAVLDEIIPTLGDASTFAFESAAVDVLAVQRKSPLPIWDNAVGSLLRAYRIGLAPTIRDWRKAGRERQSFTRSGKSMWAVQHLTDVRRTLMSWSLLGRQSGEVRRLDRSGRGIFAAHLLEHIDNLKADRLKTGADLIVRASMGYVRDKAGNWLQRHAPCDVVLFEDLSRYRMRTDRPRRENSQLMRWAHRAVPGEVAMQGMLHGLEICETSAAFSSRYHARTQAPGIRCRALTRDDLGNAWLRADLEQVGIDLEVCRAGDLVPRDGGEVFACLDGGGNLVRIDADINAAQNLQRRFWTRHSTAFRLPCTLGDRNGQPIWVPRPMGKRLSGAIGGTGLLVPTGHDTGSCRWEQLKTRGAARSGSEGEEVKFGGDEEEDIAALAEEAEIESGRVEVFFRDPSGGVLPAGLWYPSKTFWGIVRARTIAALKRGLGAGGSA
ncbi:MAG: hypothetical protein FJX55_15845 [Alphaproteobacteria bacterium]|nr:hypothetical protein [Alphaproteobacteria bacterium]